MPSASPTAAFRDFQQNLDYAKRMVESARLLSRRRVGSLDVDDLYRAAWVQAVAALDHWVHEEIYHRALVIAQYPGTAKPRRFLEFEIPMQVHEGISSGSVPFESTFRSYLKEKLGHRSYQNPAKIREGLALVSDVNLWDAVAKILTSEKSDGTIVQPKDVTAELSRITARRNRIAHEADRDPDQPSVKAQITAEEVEAVISWLSTAVAAILLAVGDTEAPSAGPAALRKETEIRIAKEERADRFESQLGQYQAEYVSVRLILDQWMQHGGWATYGDRDETIAFLILSSEAADFWPISIYPVTGKISVMFGDMSRLAPFDDVDLRLDLLEQINEIPGVSIPEESLSGRPSFPIAALRGQGAAGLWNALEWFIRQVPRD